MTDAQLLALAGIVALALGAIDVWRTRGEDLAAWGVVVLGAALALAYLNSG